MKHLQVDDRPSYLTRQVKASTSKFSYCKVSYGDVANYVEIIAKDKRIRRDESPFGPVVCLGVRNGREVDLFRIVLGGSRTLKTLTRSMERQWHGWKSRLPIIERFGRHSIDHLGPGHCIGVELNPLAHRSDIWVGSFDLLPDEWTGKFGVVYCNAFDHAFDPWATAAVWRRVLRPGGYLVLGFPGEQDGSALDPVSGVTLADVQQLFPGELVFYRRFGSSWGYTEYVVRF